MHRIWGLCVSCRRKLFLKFATDVAIDHSGGNGCHLLFLALNRVFKSVEALSFHSSAETNVVRRDCQKTAVPYSQTHDTKSRTI